MFSTFPIHEDKFVHLTYLSNLSIMIITLLRSNSISNSTLTFLILSAWACHLKPVNLVFPFLLFRAYPTIEISILIKIIMQSPRNLTMPVMNYYCQRIAINSNHNPIVFAIHSLISFLSFLPGKLVSMYVVEGEKTVTNLYLFVCGVDHRGLIKCKCADTRRRTTIELLLSVEMQSEYDPSSVSV